MKSNFIKTKKITVNGSDKGESVRVTSNSTASLTILADETRDLMGRDFRKLIALVNEYRKADKHADKFADVLDQLILDARTLSDREWKQTVRLSKTLRKADREMTKSQLIEKRAKQQRLREAQQ